MGDDAHEMRFAHGRDLEHFGYSAHVGQRGAHEVDVVILDEWIEVPAVAPLRARSQRNVYFLAQDREILEKGFCADGVLHKKWGQIFDQVAAANRIGKIESLMEIDSPVAILSHAVAHRGADVAHSGYALAC